MAPPTPPREDVAAELHPLLAERYSPRAFLPDRVPDEHVAAMLEAARWTPSSNNRQPWRFVVAPAGSDGHAAIVSALVKNNPRWAPAAPLLLLACAKMRREEDKPARHAPYDLGQAVAHLTFQAATLGYAVHQMAGIDSDTARAACAIPPGFDPYTAIAIGRPGDAASLPDDLRERELRTRTRQPVSDFAFAGRWGEPWTPCA